MEKFAAMGKEALRAECRSRGISYGKLDNAGMRQALSAAEAQSAADLASDERFLAELAAAEAADLASDEQVLAALAAAQAADEVAANAAHAAAVEEAFADLGVAGAGEGLAGEEAVVAPASKPQKARDRRNGVTRPKPGGKCAAIWDYLGSCLVVPSLTEIKLVAEASGWDLTTTTVQYYRWRNFNGIYGRSK